MGGIPFATSSRVQAAAIFLAEKAIVKSLIATNGNRERAQRKGRLRGVKRPQFVTAQIARVCGLF